MTTVSTDLAAWLLARIAEDEATARNARPGGWRVKHDRHQFGDGSSCEAWGIDSDTPWSIPGPLGSVREDDGVVAIGYDRDYGTPEAAFDHEPTAEHVALWDPARVLAECEAKRAIVGLVTDYHSYHMSDDFSGENLGDDILQALALPYTDHPDYREEWRP